MQFFIGLNDSYFVSRRQTFLMQFLPNTRRVYFLILQQEKQVEVFLNRGNINHYAMFVDQHTKIIRANRGQKQKIKEHITLFIL